MDWRMTGQISVGVVFVESSLPGGPTFSSSERYRIKQEVVDGLSWLAARHPAGDLSWILEYQTVRLDVENRETADNEDYWMYPAISRITYQGSSYPGTYAGLLNYLADMHAANGSTHEMVLFLTAYRGHWPGMALAEIVFLSKQDDWGGWGRKAVDGLVIHETCHIFGAADEYTGGLVTCTGCEGEIGIDNIPNGNCELCARPHQPCIMTDLSRRMCNYTKGQIGWADDIFVELETANVMWAGTDDHVELDIGRRVFTLDTPHHNDRERNNREGYALWTGGVPDDEMLRVLIRKSHDSVAGGWKMKRVRVWHKGVLYCDQSPNVWLEDDHRTWTGCVSSTQEVPIGSLVVKVTTADHQWAGTDDDVTLKLAGRSWNLDNRWHNDFERGHTDTFNLDPGVGLFRSDIHTVTILKSRDGVAGGWNLGGLKIIADDYVLYDNPSIDTWLEDDSRIWTAPI
jgi:hypothetical protein